MASPHAPALPAAAGSADDDTASWHLSLTPARVLNLALVLVLAAMVASSVVLISVLRSHQALRADLAELDDISHGMLDAGVWIAQVSAIIDKKIEQFRFTPDRRREIKPVLERMLDAFITKSDEVLRRQRQSPSLGTRLKEDVREKLISVDVLRAAVPGEADAILDEMAKPSSRRQLEGVLRSALSNLSEQTHTAAGPAEQRLAVVHREYSCTTQRACEEAIGARIERNHHAAMLWMTAVLALALVLFAGVGLSSRHATSRTRLALLVLGCATLLACGVLTPMLDIEARISSLSLVVLDEPVEFRDQVLYFHSKGVLDMVEVLARTGKPELMLVGLLLVTFSIFFPLFKIAASFLYLFDVWGCRRHWLVQFFALKSSKWSMADVFVVATFMAYIGFNGVINEELKEFAKAGAPSVKVLTTNGSSLQPGYFLFLAFCIAGLVTSSLFNAVIAERAEAAAH